MYWQNIIVGVWVNMTLSVRFNPDYYTLVVILSAFFAFLFRASCPSPFGPHFVRSKIFQKFLSRTIKTSVFICVHLWIKVLICVGP